MKDNVTGDPSLDWYSWGQWSSCSSVCGIGVRWRRRECLKNPRFCPQSSRPNSLFYEKTQLQDCQFIPCVNRTLTENSLMSTGDVGISIAISSSIIALVFILAKTLHCMTEDRRRRGCCKNSNTRETSSTEATLPENNTLSQSAVHQRTGIENLAGPVYITITQEMITGNTASVPVGSAQTDARATIPPISSSHTDVRVTRTMSSPNCSNRRDVISLDPNGTVSVNLNPTNSLSHIANPEPSGSTEAAVAINTQEVNTNTNRRMPITSESDSTENESAEHDAAQAVYSPPSYESIFPLFKRNQTM